MLQFEDISVFYGKTQVLWNVSLHVNEGEIVAIVGSNGSGKSTILKTLSGMVRPSSGSITFLNRRIDNLQLHSIVDLGLSHVPEGGKVFKDMSVCENLDMGAYPRKSWKQRAKTIEEVYRIFPALRERASQLARTLSGGEQQMLAMGRGLMSRPKLCVFDEPSYGLAPMLVKEVFSIIKSLHERGITILLIEQNVRYSLEVANRAYILENGRITIEAGCQELLCSDYIRKAYLGL